MKSIYLKIIISLLPAIGLYYIGLNILSNDTKIFGFISYYYLIWVLMITPLAYVFTEIKSLKKYSNTIVSYRRPVWIMAWVFALVHMFKFDQKIYEMWEKLFATQQSFLSFIFDSIFNPSGWAILGMHIYSFWAGTIWIVIMFFLLMTSNNFAQRVLWWRVWKRLQQLVYPLFILVVIHIYFLGGWKWLYLYPAIMLFSLRFYSWFHKNFRYTGRKKISHSWYRRFLCPPCWFIYDEELWDEDGWLAPGTKFEEIPDDWICPVCWAEKKDFIPLDGHYNPEEPQDHELTFTIVSKTFLTADVIELKLYCSRDLEIIPWQYCKLVFQWQSEINMRSYSVSLYRDNILTFLIKLKDWGVAWEVLREITQWGEMRWIWPFWDFVLQNTTRRKIFVATGTGLSPIYNMMHASWDSEKILYFWVRNQEDLFYLDELSSIPNLRLHIYLSGEESRQYATSRIDYSKIDYQENDEIYICGSAWLIEGLEHEFKKTDKKDVFFEKFL